MGDETRKYIEIRQTSIEEGHWPAATNEAENLDLRLRLHAGGKETDIVFREYMGERMEQPNYVQDVIGTPKAAMILFNPGMPGLRSAESRNRMIGNIKVVAQHLKDHKCAAVAFVVTASDRLTADLEGFRDEFERYASLVTTHLDALGLKWKRFDVTITGRLEDQGHPKLALGEDNTTLDPFLWLLDRIHAQFTQAKTIRIAALAAIVAVIVLAASCIQQSRSASKLAGITAETNQVESRLADAWKTRSLADCNSALSELKTLAKTTLPSAPKFGSSNKEKAKQLAGRLSSGIDLWGVRMLALEFDDYSAKIGKDLTLVANRDWAKKFDDALNTAKPSETKAVEELHALQDKWVAARPDMEKKWQVANLGKEIKQKVVQLDKANGDKIPPTLKESFDFLSCIARDYPLVENREALSARLDAARTNALARYCASITTWSVDDETPPIAGPVLRQRLKTDLSGKISDAEFRSTEQALIERQQSARAKWDAYQLPKQTREHETALKAAGANPISALKTSLLFLGSMTNDFPTVPQLTIREKRHAIERARKEAMAAYADSIASKWNVEAKNPPEFNSENCRASIEAAVTQDESNDFILALNKRFNQAKQQWSEYQRQLVEQFRMEGDIQSVVREYGEFIDDNPNNPWLGKLHEQMEEKIGDFFVDYIKDYYNEFFENNRIGSETYAQSRMERAQRRFNDFRAVCLAITGKGFGGSPIQTSAIGKFASSCVTAGNLQNAGITAAFGQIMRITQVEVMFQPSSLDSSYTGMDFRCNVLAERWNVSSGQKETVANSTLFGSTFLGRGSNGRWMTLWTGSYTLRTNPWTFTSFRLYFSERLDALMITPQDDSRGWWLDFEAGQHTINYQADIHFVHDALWNTDVAGKLSVRMTFSGEGPDFLSLWKKAMQ